MRTINSERIYNRHEFCQILNEAYRDADDPENVRIDTVSRNDNFNIYRIHFYDYDCELIDFTINVHSH